MLTIKEISILMRWLKNPSQENEEKAIKLLEKRGYNEKAIDKLKIIIEEGNAAYLVENEEDNHEIDRLYVAGVGVLNLILLQVISSIGKLDVWTYIAWISLAISLPCTATSLFISAWRARKNYTEYSLIHRRVAQCSIFFGAFSVASVVGYFCLPAFFVLIITSIVTLLLIGSIYRSLTNERVRRHFDKIIKTLNE